MIAAFQFFHTSHCHLCDVAEAIITPIFQSNGLLCETIDIADDVDALERYGVHIPVLYVPSLEQTLFWPFGEADVTKLITEYRIQTDDFLPD